MASSRAVPGISAPEMPGKKRPLASNSSCGGVWAGCGLERGLGRAERGRDTSHASGRHEGSHRTWRRLRGRRRTLKISPSAINSSCEPIHVRDPTKLLGLSPARTSACSDEMGEGLRNGRGHGSLTPTIQPRPARHLLDLGQGGNGRGGVPLQLVPAAD